MVYECWIGKCVVIILKNGFRKFGVLANEDDKNVYLKFYTDGMPRPISKDEIANIDFDKKHLEVSK